MSHKNKGLHRLLMSTVYTSKGLKRAFCCEAAFRQELYLAVVLVPIALWVDVSAIERVLLIASLGLVLIVELLNSAIEAVVDRIGSEHHELSGAAKDMGSAAVFIALMLVVFVWLAILLPGF